MTWGDLLDNFGLVVQDLQDIGVNVCDQTLMRSMPGVWLRCLVAGLFTRPLVGYREEPIERSDRVRLVPIWPNRVQAHFFGATATA